MNNKKIISLLCTTAMAASAFAAFTVTANAEDTVLYSNNFNGYPVGRALAVSYSAQWPASWVDAANGGNTTFANFIEWNVPNTYDMTDSAGKTISIKCGNGNDDDTSAVYVNEESGDNYISLPKARFSHKNSGLSLTGFESFAANAGEDLLVSFKMKMTKGVDNSSVEYTPDILVGNIGTLAIDGTNIVDGEWVNVRIVIPATGDAAVYVGDSETPLITAADGNLDSGITMSTNDKDRKSSVYPYCNIDELVIMSVGAGTGSTANVPAANEVSFDESTTPETPSEVAAPSIAAPADVTMGDTFDFDLIEPNSWIFGESAQEVKDIDNMVINIGGRSGGGDTITGATVSEYGGSNVLTLQGGKFSTAGRGPVVSLTNNLDISLDTSKTAVMAFAVRLSSTAEDGVGRLYLLKDNIQTGDKGDGEYRNVMAVLTTDGTGETITRGGNGEDVIGIDVTADEWHVVTVMVSDNRYRVFVDDATEPNVVQQYVASGNNATTATALPILAVTSASSSGASTFSKVMIDNMITYTGVLGEKASDLLPTVTENSWTKYVATYDESGVLTSLEVSENQTAPEAMTSDGNTKTMYWNSKMTPYVAE